jgi:hypothetical protein
MDNVQKLNNFINIPLSQTFKHFTVIYMKLVCAPMNPYTYTNLSCKPLAIQKIVLIVLTNRQKQGSIKS